MTPPDARSGPNFDALPTTPPRRDGHKPQSNLSPPDGLPRNVPDLVDTILQQALVRRASDVHLEPAPDGLRVRYRIDGLLRHVMSIPRETYAPVISRVKIMSNLDIAEHRQPQDGRIRLKRGQRTVDIRVSAVPSLHGEKIVLRLLDLEAVSIPLEQCGLDAATLAKLRHLIRRPQGVVFVTGPTGSGKTSTIYACLNEIKSETTNIVTIEDPIEYEIPGITQIAVNEKIGLSFSACLRSILRQDPDVILVGEVRDQETARTAMQASLTGHLVFATLHTNDALGAIVRLLDMGIPPYLIASSLNAVLAQRLVRVLCPDCKAPWEPDAAARTGLRVDEESRVLSRAAGCARCYHSGVVGRTAIAELVVITSDLRELIAVGADEAELRKAAPVAGVKSLFMDGAQKVLDGIIAYEELLRVAEPERSFPKPAPRLRRKEKPGNRA